MDREIKKYNDFREAIKSVLVDMFGETNEMDIGEIVNRVLFRDEWTYSSKNLKLMDHYLQPGSDALYVVADDHFGDSY